MKIGLMIKDLRVKKGLTQDQLAEKTEVSTRTIQRIEKCEVNPRTYTLQMIAKALDVEYSTFNEKEPNEDLENEEESNSSWVSLLHLSGLLPLIFPTLIIWNRKRDKKSDLSIHLRAVISFQITILAIVLIGVWIYWRKGEPTPLFGGLLAGALTSLVNAISVMNGKGFINPFVRYDKNLIS